MLCRVINTADPAVLSKHAGADVDVIATSGEVGGQQCSAEDVVLASCES